VNREELRTAAKRGLEKGDFASLDPKGTNGAFGLDQRKHANGREILLLSHHQAEPRNDGTAEGLNRNDKKDPRNVNKS